MVSFWRGSLGAGAFCAKAGAPKTTRASATRKAQSLIIDDHAPGHAADRNGNDRLLAFRIDDRDVVAEAVRDIQKLLVPRHGDAPGALADQHIALRLAARHIDHRHMGRMAER